MKFKIRVTCPHCQQDQEEADGAISTFCRSCGQHFSVREVLKKRSVKLPKLTRLIHCRQCGGEVKVVPTALSTQCLGCGAYLDLRNHQLTRSSTEKLTTYGEIYFAPGSRYQGMEVRAYKIKVAGAVNAQLKADEEIEISGDAIIQGKLEAPLIKVLRNAKATATSIQTEKLEIDGSIQLGEGMVTEHLFVSGSGTVEATRLKLYSLEVADGGTLSAQIEMFPARQALYEEFQLDPEQPKETNATTSLRSEETSEQQVVPEETAASETILLSPRETEVSNSVATKDSTAIAKPRKKKKRVVK